MEKWNQYWWASDYEEKHDVIVTDQNSNDEKGVHQFMHFHIMTLEYDDFGYILIDIYSFLGVRCTSIC
jgi:hypothetical protein